MKRLVLVFTLILFLTGCGMLERGNYDKDRTGYVLSGDLIVSYHTNSVGEIDVFMIDEIMTYFEALEYVSFDMDVLDSETILDSAVSISELTSCGIESTTVVPRFIRIKDLTYYYNVRDNGYCTFDEYTFHEDGFTDILLYDVEDTSPIEHENVTLYKSADFKTNTFETIVFIENISYNSSAEQWEKTIITALPMSVKQSGNMYEDLVDYINEFSIIEKYVLDNQSVNLLELKADYDNPDVNNIWSDATIDQLGRDHDIIKTVRIKKTGDILDIIDDTLGRLGMFQ